MKTFKFSLFFVLVLSAGIMLIATSEDAVTVESLLKEMTDRDHLAKFPEQSFTVRQFSSYDRRSVSKDAPHWFANWDRSWFIRTEINDGRKEFVMMDSEGPGAIVRFWMTFAGENCGLGILRIYIDGASEPVIEGTAFDILSGGSLVSSPMSSSVSEATPYEHRGHNLYLPIPYSKNCKVTYESEYVDENDPGARNSENVYYNINYRTYGPDVRVESFTSETLKKYSESVNATQKLLTDGVVAEHYKNTVLLDCELAAGKSRSFYMNGPASVKELKIKIDSDFPEQALSSVLLKIEFDGICTVNVPLGQFYGVGSLAGKEIDNFYTCRTSNGTMISKWVMPFAKECILTLVNDGGHTVTISESSIGLDKWKWDKSSMYFGSFYHKYAGIDTGAGQDMEGLTQGPSDLNFISLVGQGLYVGDGISIYNPAEVWWGEGDEKVYVDGEAFPSSFGTGTEDYYGYAWCRPESFVGHPFVSQPDGGGNLCSGYSVNSRYRSLDAIPFNESLVFDMELWHWEKACMDYENITYWYLKPGGTWNWKQY